MTDAAADAAVLRRIMAGESDAFAILVRRYQRRILRLGYGFYHNQHEAEDFVQEVFLKAWSGLASFRGQAAFSTWLTRIAYNTGINGKRVYRHHETLDNDPLDAAALSIEDAQLRREAVGHLRKAMLELPARYQICLDLFFFDGLPYQGISQVTGLAVNTIKSHVFRAKSCLRAALAKELA